MTFKELFKKVFFIEILSGLALTLKHSLSPAVTRQYPEKRITPPLGTRALHALTRNESTGEAVCVGCGLCAAMCPSNCISIYTSEGEDHKKIVDRYEVNTLKCLFCALCVEACPYGAVLLTPHFEYSGYSRSEFIYTKDRLLENWDKYMGGAKSREYFDKFWTPKSADFARAESKVAESEGKQ
ncbi:MAG: NADH-quinone oxidoreductase subunit I [Nitrospirota bacterium]